MKNNFVCFTKVMETSILILTVDYVRVWTFSVFLSIQFLLILQLKSIDLSYSIWFD